jgi:hypothetical protein
MEALSEIKRYYPCDVRLKSGDAQVMFTEHLDGQLCIYEDVVPIIQRNRELEEEIKQLREQEPVAFGNLKPSVTDSDRVLFTDIDAAKRRHNNCCQLDALYLHAGAELKPAQEIQAELLAWVRIQRNDIPATGEEFANAIELWLEDKSKGGV